MTISKAKNKLIFHQEGLFHTSIGDRAKRGKRAKTFQAYEG
jgi:hypothetical protein